MSEIDDLVASVNKKYKTNIVRKASELKSGLTSEGAGREYWRIPYQDCIYRMYGEDDGRAWAQFVIDTAVNK